MKPKHIIIGYIAFVFITVMLVSVIKRPVAVDKDTQEQCRIYAARNHKGEIAPDRYKWLGKEFIDGYDWYGSCVNHTRYPVAK